MKLLIYKKRSSSIAGFSGKMTRCLSLCTVSYPLDPTFVYPRWKVSRRRCSCSSRCSPGRCTPRTSPRRSCSPAPLPPQRSRRRPQSTRRRRRQTPEQQGGRQRSTTSASAILGSVRALLFRNLRALVL